VPTVTREAYAIPKIEFSIHLQPHNVIIAPEPNKIPQDSLNWGDFHNGVAAALRISPSSNVIDSSWIKFNRPSELTPEHAGFLYGLGLTGHLREMLTWHTFGYLTPKHDLTSIGILLGLSAANVGSGNRHVTKLLAVHTPALLPTPTIDLNVPLITQAAGLVGLGLLYMGSKNRRMAEVCLKQISRNDLTQPDLSNEHREAYAMAAALAFGMVTLGEGSAVPIPADEALVSELRILIHGEAPSNTRGKRTRAAFDINLTSPAASMALGLMYLRTESQEVADILTIPDTIMALNRIPPNFLLLRTLSRNLILWARIAPTREWVDAQLPPYIINALEERAQGKSIDDAIELAYYNIVAGCCFAIALKYAGTAREEPYIFLINYYDTFSRMAYTNGRSDPSIVIPGVFNNCRYTVPAYDHKIKRHAIRDGLNLISISLNIVMAGTGEINCLRRLRYSYGMYNQAMRYGTHMATHMSLGLLFLGGGRYTLGSSDAAIACLVAAFFPRFSPVSSDNKSYLQALRHLWVLAVEPRCLIARDVDTKDIVYLPVKIKVKEGSSVEMAQLISPTLIPDFDKVLSIRVDTPRYWPFYLDLANIRRHKSSLLRSQTIYVKRRTAFLSYLEDPKGSRSLFVRSGSSSGDAATLDFPRLTDTKAHTSGDLNQFISSFSIEPFFLAFADHFCRNDIETDQEQLFNTYCRASLLDSILQDKPQTLQSHLLLYRYRTMKPSSRHFHLRLQDLRFAVDFYSKLYDRRFSGRSESNPRAPLIREGTLSGTLYALDQQLEIVRTDPAFLSALGAYARGESIPTSVVDAMPLGASAIAWYLLRNNVPVSTLLGVLQVLAQRAHAACVDLPTPEGSAGDTAALERGIREVLHATGTQMTTTLGSGWATRSLDEILQVWRMGATQVATSGQSGFAE
jgi:anaphase-promoting complex subunit 1